MTFIRNLFRKTPKAEEPATPLHEGITRSTNLQWDMSLSEALDRIDEAERQYAAGNEQVYCSLLQGSDGFAIGSAPTGGHNHNAAHEALHLYQALHPNIPMAQRFEDGLRLYYKEMHSRDDAELAFSYIGLELKKAENQNAAFTVNCQQLYYDLMTAIAHNREEIEDDLPFFGEWLEDRKEFIKEYLK